MSFGILGCGEIGSSLHKVYELAGITDVSMHDPCKGFHASLSDCEIVNVCIPFFGYQQFTEAVRDIKLSDGCVVIVQSTIPVGCTDRFQADFPKLMWVHSPVRGVHPSLTQGLLVFEKFLGISDCHFQDKSIRCLLLEHVKRLDMTPVLCRAKESELAKVVSTTLYGINIAAVTDVFNLCKDNAVDFETVFTKWQTGYNTGYRALGKPNVCRPVLTPVPDNDEGQKVIGGHCVLPNCMILKEHMGETNLSDFVLRYSDKKSLVHTTKNISHM